MDQVLKPSKEKVHFGGLVSGTRILMSLMPGFGFLLAMHWAIMEHRPDIVDSHHRVSDTSDFRHCYDFIIIGGGSAGAVMANRLSENPKWNVLLLEAGGDEHVLGDVPMMMPVLQQSEIDWMFQTVPDKGYCRAMKEGSCNWPRGKVLGGCSSINAMLYARGNKRDYDKWEQLGNPGWGFDQVLPYFKKSEDMRIPEYQNDKYHSVGGYLTIEKFRYKQPLTWYFETAMEELGYDMTDINGEKQTGYTNPHGTLRNGLRCSTAKAFLRPAGKRENLHISLHSFVEKILINHKTKRAYGVKFKKEDEVYTVHSSNEVILSAGAIQSPQILMLSGVGDSEHLADLGIKPIVHLPGVGQNLQDHVAMGGNPYMYTTKHGEDLGLNAKELFTDDTIKKFVEEHDGPMYNLPECEIMGFVKTKYANHSDDYPDIQLFLGSSAENTDGGLFGKRDMGLSDEVFAVVYEDILYKPTYSAVPLLLRPKSRGYIKLKDKNPESHPLIYPNYFDHPDDIKVLIEGAKIAYSLSQTPTMRKLKTTLYPRKVPGCDHYEQFSDEHLACQARHHTLTIYHPIGTCKMGACNDPLAVVDHRLRVHGVRSLRVVDASIMPLIVSANTNAPTIMIAEKASDMIKEEWLGVPDESYMQPEYQQDGNSESYKDCNTQRERQMTNENVHPCTQTEREHKVQMRSIPKSQSFLIDYMEVDYQNNPEPNHFAPSSTSSLSDYHIEIVKDTHAPAIHTYELNYHVEEQIDNDYNQQESLFNFKNDYDDFPINVNTYEMDGYENPYMYNDDHKYSAPYEYMDMINDHNGENQEHEINGPYNNDMKHHMNTDQELNYGDNGYTSYEENNLNPINVENHQNHHYSHKINMEINGKPKREYGIEENSNSHHNYDSNVDSEMNYDKDSDNQGETEYSPHRYPGLNVDSHENKYYDHSINMENTEHKWANKIDENNENHESYHNVEEGHEINYENNGDPHEANAYVPYEEHNQYPNLNTIDDENSEDNYYNQHLNEKINYEHRIDENNHNQESYHKQYENHDNNADHEMNYDHHNIHSPTNYYNHDYSSIHSNKLDQKYSQSVENPGKDYNHDSHSYIPNLQFNDGKHPENYHSNENKIESNYQNHGMIPNHNQYENRPQYSNQPKAKQGCTRFYDVDKPFLLPLFDDGGQRKETLIILPDSVSKVVDFDTISIPKNGPIDNKYLLGWNVESYKTVLERKDTDFDWDSIKWEKSQNLPRVDYGMYQIMSTLQDEATQK